MLLSPYTKHDEAIPRFEGMVGCGMRTSPHKSNIGRAPTPDRVRLPERFDDKAPEEP